MMPGVHCMIVLNSFAITVCKQVRLFFNERFQSIIGSHFSSTIRIKADRKWNLKLKSNAICTFVTYKLGALTCSKTASSEGGVWGLGLRHYYAPAPNRRGH